MMKDIKIKKPLQQPMLKKTCRDYRQVINAQCQSGTAMSEYLIGTIGVVIAVFLPIPGLNESALMLLVDALRGFQANTTYIMSLP